MCLVIWVVFLTHHGRLSDTSIIGGNVTDFCSGLDVGVDGWNTRDSDLFAWRFTAIYSGMLYQVYMEFIVIRAKTPSAANSSFFFILAGNGYYLSRLPALSIDPFFIVSSCLKSALGRVRFPIFTQVLTLRSTIL